MKKLYARAASSEQMENNLIPMINIIFLLLIFFMIAGHISRQAKPSELELAIAESELKVKPSNAKLSLTKAGQYYQDDQQKTLDEIESYFEKNKKITAVNLQADKSVTSGELDTLLDVLRSEGVAQIEMTVRQASP